MDHTLTTKRLLYLSTHRGCKETDFILGRFAVQYLEQMDEAASKLYEQFLHEDDWDIYAWITGTVALPAQYQHPVIDLLRKSVFS